MSLETFSILCVVGVCCSWTKAHHPVIMLLNEQIFIQIFQKISVISLCRQCGCGGENNGFFISGRIVWFLELTHHFHGDLQLLIENRISFKWFSSPRWAEWPMTITTLNWVLTAGLIGRLLRKYWKYGQQTKLNWMFYLFLIKIIFLFIYFCFIKNVKKRKLNKQLCIVVCYEHADLIGNSFLMN